MMKKHYIWIISISIITICIAIYINVSSSQKLTPVDLKDMQNNVAKEVSFNKEYQEKTMEWAEKMQKVTWS